MLGGIGPLLVVGCHHDYEGLVVRRPDLWYIINRHCQCPPQILLSQPLTYMVHAGWSIGHPIGIMGHGVCRVGFRVHGVQGIGVMRHGAWIAGHRVQGAWRVWNVFCGH